MEIMIDGVLQEGEVSEAWGMKKILHLHLKKELRERMGEKTGDREKRIRSGGRRRGNAKGTKTMASTIVVVAAAGCCFVNGNKCEEREEKAI